MRRAVLLAFAVLLPLAVQPAQADASETNRKAAARTLAWLLDQNDLLDTPEGNSFAHGKAVCALAMTGFLLEQFPEHKDFDKHRARILQQLAPSIREGAPAQQSWSDGFYALYLAERHWRGKDQKKQIARIVQRFEETQNADGGWGHGGISVSFYPTTLLAATNMAITAIGIAQRLGIETDPEVVASALKLYEEQQSAAGAWPYGGRPYRKGYEAGRTAAGVLALRALRLEASPMVARAEAYVAANVERVPMGHASPAMHVVLGAMAFAAGDKAAPYRAVLKKVVAHQNDDGTFRDIVPHSPDSTEILGRNVQDRAYLSALYAAALVSEGSKVVQHIREGAKPTPKLEEPAPRAPRLAPVWRHDAANVVGVLPKGDAIRIVTREGKIHSLQQSDGEATGKPFQVEPPEGMGFEVAMATPGRVLLVAAQPRRGQAVPVRVVNGVPSTNPRPLVLHGVDENTGDLLWKSELRMLVNGAMSAGDELLLTSRVQPPLRLSLEDGTQLGPIPSPSAAVNRAVAVADDGRIAVTGEAALWVMSRDREILWKRKSRSRRGLLAPARGALAWMGGQLLEGTSSGVVRCRDGETGKVLWRLDKNAYIESILVVGDRIVILAGDGTVVCATKDGRVAWRYVPSLARETGRQQAGMVTDETRLAIAGPYGPLRVFDIKTGKIEGTAAADAHEHFLLTDSRLLVFGPEGVRAYELR